MPHVVFVMSTLLLNVWNRWQRSVAVQLSSTQSGLVTTVDSESSHYLLQRWHFYGDRPTDHFSSAQMSVSPRLENRSPLPSRSPLTSTGAGGRTADPQKFRMATTRSRHAWFDRICRPQLSVAGLQRDSSCRSRSHSDQQLRRCWCLVSSFCGDKTTAVRT